ncbi:MAG TPA: DinB family protein [Bacteroidota bacterium]|nr:DinB family protein [Bacteroidota bacterium]
MSATEKDMFLQTWEREFQTTLKILKAYPADKLDLKPSEKSKSARDLAFTFTGEQALVDMALKGKIEFTGGGPSAPNTMNEIIASYENAVKANMEKVKAMSDTDFNSMIGFFVAPKTPGQVRKADVLWLTINDMIHHRGQLSVYLRMAGGKLPSIYGPTADEPWM